MAEDERKEQAMTKAKSKRAAKHPAFFDCEADLRATDRNDFIASQARQAPF